MRGINKVILIGNVGKDPDVRYSSNGSAVAKFSLATNESWKDKDGNQKEHTEWHNIVAFGKTADVIGEHVKKGDSLYIEGQLQTQKWQGDDGKDRYTTSLKVRDWQFVGGKGGDGNKAKPVQQPKDYAVPGDDLNDDLPFSKEAA